METNEFQILSYAILVENFIIRATSYETAVEIEKGLRNLAGAHFFDKNLTFEKAKEVFEGYEIKHWTNFDSSCKTEILFKKNETARLASGFFDSDGVFLNARGTFYKARKNGLLKTREQLIETKSRHLDSYDEEMFSFGHLKDN